jgi:hypothetical protein
MIKNYPDDDVNQMCEKLSIHQNHSFWPKHPFRSLIVGPAGSGKSNLLLNMLFGCEDGATPGLNYDRVHYYLKHEHEEKFQFIKNKFEQIEQERACEFKIFTYGIEMDDVVQSHDIDKDLMTLVIFDDFPASKDEDQTVIKNLYLTGSKHNNTSIIYTSQSFFHVPMFIRDNVSHLFLFRIRRPFEIDTIASYYATGLTVNEFKQLYETCVSKAYGFMTIGLASV